MKTSLVLIYQIEFQKIELFQKKKETDFFYNATTTYIIY